LGEEREVGERIKEEKRERERESTKMVRKLHVTPVMQSSWQSWLQGNPLAIRMLLFTAKKSVPLMMQALALEYTGELLIGVSLNDTEFSKEIGIPSMPSLPALVFIKGEPEGEPNERGEVGVKLQTQVLDSRKLSYIKLVTYADNLADQGKMHMEEMRAKTEAFRKEASGKEEL
jgi:hypothetical protein